MKRLHKPANLLFGPSRIFLLFRQDISIYAIGIPDSCMKNFEKELYFLVKKIGIVIKSDPEAIKTANELEKWLHSKNISVVRRENLRPRSRISDSEKPYAPPDLFCVFVLGGDGTFLSAVRWLGDQNIPILGIKFGEVGFLAETAEGDLFSAAEYILNNEFATQPRMRLVVEVTRG